MIASRTVDVAQAAPAFPYSGPEELRLPIGRALSRVVDPEVAMTGEITLTGQVLPIGGVKEKVLGAKRAGIRKVILPRRNEIDLEDVPKEIRDTMEFALVDELSEVFANALGKRIITPVLLGVTEPRRTGNVVALRPRVKQARSVVRKRADRKR